MPPRVSPFLDLERVESSQGLTWPVFETSHLESGRVFDPPLVKSANSTLCFGGCMHDYLKLSKAKINIFWKNFKQSKQPQRSCCMHLKKLQKNIDFILWNKPFIVLSNCTFLRIFMHYMLWKQSEISTFSLSSKKVRNLVWANMGLGKFGWGKHGSGQIWFGANMGLGKSWHH